MAKKIVNDLPEGMITEKLVRLPVKTLVQCKLVCKPWLSIISDPRFVKFQLLHAITASLNNPTLLTLEKPPLEANELTTPPMCSSLIALIHTSDEDDEEEQLSSRSIQEVFKETNDKDLSNSPVHFDHLIMPRSVCKYRGFAFRPDHRVISSYNGIICLPNEIGTVVYLWNPSIRKCKKLPSPTPYTSGPLPVDVGLGYDSISNDYKVLRIVFEKKGDLIPIVHVYSTNADYWREFRVPLLRNWEISLKGNIVVNSVLYFAGRDKLISFDLHKEIVGVVPFPRFITRNKSNVLNFKGSVAMVFESGSGVDLWTLDDVSSKVIWTKRFSIKADSELEIWICEYLGAQQFFGYKFFDDRIMSLYNVLYDYEKKETKFCGYGPHEEQNIYATLKYTETLVSFDGFEQVE